MGFTGGGAIVRGKRPPERRDIDGGFGSTGPRHRPRRRNPEEAGPGAAALAWPAEKKVKVTVMFIVARPRPTFYDCSPRKKRNNGTHRLGEPCLFVPVTRRSVSGRLTEGLAPGDRSCPACRPADVTARPFASFIAGPGKLRRSAPADFRCLFCPGPF